MSEVRHDWLTDRWVIFAPSRSERPDEFEYIDQQSRVSLFGCDYESGLHAMECPFCHGHERETPPSVLTLGGGLNGKGKPLWKVRVVPNKFPAVIPVDSIRAHSIRNPSEVKHDPSSKPNPSSKFEASSEPIDSLLFHRQAMTGAHEVFIESPNHASSVTQLPNDHLELVFQAFRLRLAHWRQHESLQYAVVFKNCGADAGASLVHTHSQLIATHFVPPEVTRVCHRMEDYRERFGSCLACATIAEETKKKERVIRRTDSFVAICPFASSLPYLFSIMPIHHQSRFEELEGDLLKEFSGLVHSMLRSLEGMFPNNAYNFVLHTSPFHEHWDRAFHWRLEIFPRLTKLAGFEWGSNCFINPVLPEFAAEQYRIAGVDSAVSV